MKISTIIKSFILLAAVSLCSMATYAAGPEMTDVEVVRDGDNAKVTFRLSVPRSAVKSNYAMALQPVITDGTHSVSLHPVVVRGRRAVRLDTRYNWASRGVTVNDSAAEYMRPGKSIDYSDAVEFQYWMDGAALQMESLTWGCCSTEQGPGLTIAENILPTEPEYIDVVEYPVIPEPAPETTGDMMARTFRFIVPESEYNPAEPIYDDDRENAIIVYYRQNISVIQSDYMDNRLTLTNLDAAVQSIIDSEDSEISRIVVAGFASPEGYYSRNDRLAWNRAVAVKEYIMRRHDIPDIDIQTYNGSEDWQGLRMMVEESDLPNKEQILHIIRTYPVLGSDGIARPRREQLQKLDGGRTYRYLYNNFFPKLRTGAFIRVYYKNTNENQ